MYIKQQTAQSAQTRFNSLYVKLPCVDLIEVDRVEACCDIKSGVLVKRSKDKLPGILEGAGGLLLRTVASVDGSHEVFRSTPQFYTAQQRTSGSRSRPPGQTSVPVVGSTETCENNSSSSKPLKAPPRPR